MKFAAPLLLLCSAAWAAAPAGPGYCIYGGQSGKPFDSEAAFKSVVWRSDVVYAGDLPGAAAGARAQLEALKSMRIARGTKLAVAFGALEDGRQEALDALLAGRLDEAGFLEKSGWDAALYAYYKPALDFAAANKLKGLALGLPAAVSVKIARGGLGALSSEEKKLLPEKLEISAHKKYAEYLARNQAGPAYAEAAAAWNEAAGALLAGWLAANPGHSALVLAGNERLLYNAALPAAVKARLPDVRQASFYAAGLARCPGALDKAHKDLANYVWYLDPAPPPAPAPAAPASLAAPQSAAGPEPLPKPSVLAPAALPAGEELPRPSVLPPAEAAPAKKPAP
jgi:uncharacterized iron-regulated protein